MVLIVDADNEVTFALTYLLTDYFLKLVSLSKYSLNEEDEEVIISSNDLSRLKYTFTSYYLT